MNLMPTRLPLRAGIRVIDHKEDQSCSGGNILLALMVTTTGN
jgi:hypothetical protein